MRMHQPGASAKLAFRLFAVAFVSVFLVASCGGTPTSSTSAPASHFPVSITQAGRAPVSLAHQPLGGVPVTPQPPPVHVPERVRIPGHADDEPVDFPPQSPSN